MSTYAPVVGESVAQAVDATSHVVDLDLEAGRLYEFTSTVACWVSQGAAETVASAASGSMLVPALSRVVLSGGYGAEVAVIRASGDGTSTLTPLVKVGG